MPPGVASGGERLHADWSTDENREPICSLIKLFHEIVFALLGLKEQAFVNFSIQHEHRWVYFLLR